MKKDMRIKRGTKCESCGYGEAVIRYAHGPKREEMPLCDSCFTLACANEYQDSIWEERD